MKEKTKLKIIQILCIISILITAFFIQRTYAKYYERIDTTYATSIKRWVINVNGKNIHNEETLTNVMTPQFFYNEHMNTNNTLVPGRTGYFEFTIDYTNVDVPFDFSVSIEQPDLIDFEVYGYKIIDSDFEITSTTTIEDIGELNELTSDSIQTIDPSLDATKQTRALIIFRWNDSDENLMDNASDTEIAGTNLNYKVKITFKQKV